jgi:ankyrin repeat protein
VELARQLSKTAVNGSKALAATPLEIAADGRDIHTFNTILEELAVKGPEEGFNEVWEQRGFDEPRVSLPWRVLSKTDHFDERGLTYLDIKKRGNEHETSVDWKSKLLLAAIRDGKALVVQLLIELGADLQDCISGRTPLHQAASSSDPEIAEILLANGADVSAITWEGQQSPLHLAIGYGFDRTAEVLLQGGADVNAKNRALQTPLMLACEVSPKNINTTPDSESIPIVMVKMLINYGADIHATDTHGRSALHLTVASRSPDIQIIQLLLQNGNDLHSLDSRGRNAMHIVGFTS